MKSFNDICKMTQPEVKDYMKEYLSSKKYKVIDEDGFLYAKGTIPVLLVAHMDTVHKEQCKSIITVDKNKLSSPQGIGGDDRCGVFIIMNLVKELRCSVLLCEDEEVGCKGARKFTNATYQRTDESNNTIEEKYIEHLDVNYMVEFDRRGNNDAVFYSCDNTDFINFVEDMTNFKKAYGSCSDISVLMPAAKLSGVNLSSGYYNAHQINEYVMYDEMIDTIAAARELIKSECEKPFEYVEKKYTYPASRYYSGSTPGWGRCYGGYDEYDNYDDGYGYGYQGSLFNMAKKYTRPQLAQTAIKDDDLELEVTVCDEALSEKTILATGATKAECWMNFFLENPTKCFNDIVDYSWG